MRKVAAATVLAGAVLASLSLTPTAHARKKPAATWQVLRAADPITGASTCTVVASDSAWGTRFTRTGGLYPVVEKNSRLGLLVGVSSGGRYRMPSGDILWVVDGQPYRELKAADNPGPGDPTTPPPAGSIEALTAQTMRLAYAMSATSTMASGAKAREMLDEMLAGRSLLFRPAAAAPQMGLPNYAAFMPGQITSKGLRPYPLDESFRVGLTACGIAG